MNDMNQKEKIAKVWKFAKSIFDEDLDELKVDVLRIRDYESIEWVKKFMGLYPKK